MHILYFQSGCVVCICLYSDHKAKNDITNTTRDGCDNDNYVSSQIFGIVVGLLCVVIASLLCVIVIIFIR